MNLSKPLCFWLIFLVYSCDFSPVFHKKLLKAQKYLDDQEFRLAAAEYENLIESPTTTEEKLKILFQLGQIYAHHLSQLDKSIYFFEKIKYLSVDPKWKIKVDNILGNLYFSEVHNYKESEKVYYSLVNYSPPLKDYELYRYRYGVSLLRNLNLGLAKNVFKEIIHRKTNPFYYRALYQLGLCHFYGENLNEAKLIFKSLLKENSPKKIKINSIFYLGNIFEEEGDLEKAYKKYYSIMYYFPNTEIIKSRIDSVISRKKARKR